MNLWTISTQLTHGPGSHTLPVCPADLILHWEAVALTGVDAAAWAPDQQYSPLGLN